MGLNESFAAALSGAAAKGSELLRKPVEIALKGVAQGGLESANLAGFSLAVPVTLSQDVSGSGVLLLDARYAALMAELMFENDPAELPGELNELQLTAAAEALSQLLGAVGEGLSRATRRRVGFTAGEPVPTAGDGAAAARGLVKEDRVAVVDGELRIGSRDASRFALVLPGSAADALASEKAGGGSAGGPEVSLGAPQAAGRGVVVQPAQFGGFTAPPAPEMPAPGNLDLLLDVPLEITVELGRANRRVRDVLALGPGSIVELAKLAGEPVDLLVNGKPIAKGEVVVIDENFAVRIIEILAREERLAGGV